ncbi:hypothetical protein KM043_005583 [Ampulex compressa]|nr:hypothetical protein KM043_005583 [Ampulex compressa]
MELLEPETVNGRMDNCGGGQRLPPDGDEFPAAYQEFSSTGASSQEYRFVSRSSTMTANGGMACDEEDAFVGTDGYKLLSSDIVASRSVILPDNNRIALATGEEACLLAKAEKPHQEGKKFALANPEVARQDFAARDNDASSFHMAEDSAKRNGIALCNHPLYGAQGNVLVSEKKIEITGYYHKDASTMEDGQQELQKDATIDTPPPLPLTGPPKMEPIGTHGRGVPAPEPCQRKFPLNGELWRQDDKSERSVRDKIAMFSSQSSLDAPLFPSAATVTAAAGPGRRLSRYKSSEDVYNEEKGPGQKERSSFFADRTQSSFDLTDSARSLNQETARKLGQRSGGLSHVPSFSSTTSVPSKTTPIVPQKPNLTALGHAFEKQSLSKSKCQPVMDSCNAQKSLTSCATISSGSNQGASLKVVATTTALTRATSFSGSSPYNQDRASTTSEPPTSATISRTNSLASTFRRPNEDIRRTSLNQLIEQRKRSISKLRGLVIPEKEAVPIDQPIVDLPEIKSRDSILLHQVPKVTISDKWGSQSSLASNTSTASAPLKATTSFKMPAPQILSKYSPAFKRKSLAVYGSSTTSSSLNGNSIKSSQAISTASANSEPPKSLESICSPTRSDYSFEFVSTASSPEGSRSRPKAAHRKTRMDYDDSDNDSAVSSSQSSISRGFSPPMSPVPSERSTVSSSERSYVSTELSYQRRSLIMDSPTRTYSRDMPMGEREDFGSRGNILGSRPYQNERSSSSSSGSDPRSELNSRNSQIPQRQLRRSNSTDTNCSTSSTLTSGSQASAESLSRRVLKPQSVEAINRKNILASARCRSGRDLNGSPLIQRKFPDEEALPASSNEAGNKAHQRMANSGVAGQQQDVKIAYIQVADPFAREEVQKKSEEPKLPPKKCVPLPAARPPKSEMLEPSNDLKMWVRAEVKAASKAMDDNGSNARDKVTIAIQDNELLSPMRNARSSTLEDQMESIDVLSQSKHIEDVNNCNTLDSLKQRLRPNVAPRKNGEDQNDLLTILTTKSRSRSAIHVDECCILDISKCQRTLEEILGAKTESKFLRSQSIETKPEKNGTQSNSLSRGAAWESKDNRYGRKGTTTPCESWMEDRAFVSKIPTLGKPRHVDNGEEMAEVERAKPTLSKIPMARSLGRRSASVTDMKKALEKMDASPLSPQQTNSGVGGHNRFPSLDSSVDESLGPMTSEVDADRCCGEQFGSISSLASSTSLISQQELAQLVEDANLEETRGAHDVIVVLLHKENPTGSVGITLAGGADCEVKEITVHRVLAHSIADKDGRVQRGDRILSINGRSTRSLTHKESLAVLKQPRSEVVLVVSRARLEEGCRLRSRSASVETIIEGFETNGIVEDIAWGPPYVVAVYKDGAGLGFSLEGGRDSPLGDRPLLIKKIFTGGAAEKTGALRAGDQLLEVNGSDVTRMSRIEAWSLMKKLHDGEVNLLVRHPATKSS